MNLSKEESTILRRQISTVASLFEKGLLRLGWLSEDKPTVELTDAGRAWLAADDERIRQARAAGGDTRCIRGEKTKPGSPLWELPAAKRRRRQIAKAANKARWQKRKADHEKAE